MTVTVRTKSSRKEYVKNVRVYTNDRENALTQVTCKATVLAPFRSEPSLVNFGRIRRDEGAQTRTVRITRGDGPPLQPELVTNERSEFTSELVEIKPGEEYELRVTANPPWGNDRLRGAVTLRTGVPQAPQEVIRIFGMVQPRLRAIPARANLPERADEENRVRVRLAWTGEQGQILGAEVTDSRLDARIVEEHGRQYVEVVVPPGYTRQRGRATYLTIMTDDDVAPELRVPCSIKRTRRLPGRVSSPRRTPAVRRSTAKPQREPAAQGSAGPNTSNAATPLTTRPSTH